MVSPGPQTFPVPYGKYELLARIGQGGMAEVFRARMAGVAGFEKILVIKRLLPHLASIPSVVEMFVNEAKLTAQVHHRNVVQVFELGQVGDEYYMAMEHVEGTDLRQMLRAAAVSGVRVPPWFSVHVIAELLDGLAHSHALTDDAGRHRNIIHRDVTPANVFISYLGDVKLGDFGVAKDESRSSQTRTGLLKGKVPYMSPEQLYGRELDARTDVFAAGVVLWECLTQRRLFGGRPDIEAMNLICYGDRAPPSSFASDVPPEVDAIVLRALDVDVGRRTRSARELQAQLLEVLPTMRARVHQHDVRHVVEVVLGSQEAAPPPPPRPPRDDSSSRRAFHEVSPGHEVSPPRGIGAIRHYPTTEDLLRSIDPTFDPSVPPPDPWAAPPEPAPPPAPAPALPPAPAPAAPPARAPATWHRPGAAGPVERPPGYYTPIELPVISRPPARVPRAPEPPPARYAPEPARAPAEQELPPMLDPSAITPLEDDAPREDDTSRARFVDEVVGLAVAAAMAEPEPSRAPLERAGVFPGQHPFFVRAHDGVTVGPLSFFDALNVLRYEATAGHLGQVAIAGTKRGWLAAERFAQLSGLELLLDRWADREKEHTKVSFGGSYAQLGPVALFARLSRERPTGRLTISTTLQGRPVRCEVVLAEGQPTFVYVNLAELQTPELLVRKQLLTREQLDELLHYVAIEDRPLEEVAASRAGVDLARYLPSLHKERLVEVFKWPAARFALEPGAPGSHRASFAPSLASLLPELVYRSRSGDELRVTLAPYMEVSFERADRWNAGLAELRLSDAQKRAVGALGAGRTLGQSLRSGLEREPLGVALAYILLEMELLRRAG